MPRPLTALIAAAAQRDLLCLRRQHALAKNGRDRQAVHAEVTRGATPPLVGATPAGPAALFGCTDLGQPAMPQESEGELAGVALGHQREHNACRGAVSAHPAGTRRAASSFSAQAMCIGDMDADYERRRQWFGWI